MTMGNGELFNDPMTRWFDEPIQNDPMARWFDDPIQNDPMTRWSDDRTSDIGLRTLRRGTADEKHLSIAVSHFV